MLEPILVTLVSAQFFFIELELYQNVWNTDTLVVIICVDRWWHDTRYTYRNTYEVQGFLSQYLAWIAPT